MDATSTPILLTTELGPRLINTFQEATVKTYRMIWDAFIPILITNRVWVIVFLFLIFTLVSVEAYAGHWGSLGSFLYNFFYFGALLFIGLLWGPEVFAGDLFKIACTVVLYPICFWFSGFVMDKMGVRRGFCRK